MRMIHGERPDGGEGILQRCTHGGIAVGQAHAGGYRAAADVPLSNALMHKHERAGCQHVRNLAHEDQEHGELIHEHRYHDGYHDACPEGQAVPQVGAHKNVGRAACQRTGGHVKPIGRHGYGGGNAKYGGNGHRAQDVNHVIFRHEAAALNQCENHKAKHQRDNGRPVQQEAENGFTVSRPY